MLYQANIELTNLSFSLVGATEEGEQFEFHYPSCKFKWISKPSQLYDVMESTLKSRLKNSAAELEKNFTGVVKTNQINYMVHP